MQPGPDDVPELITRYLPVLRSFVRQAMGPQLRSREDSGDIVQSVAREALLHRDRFQHGAEPGFVDWLLTTARRKLTNRAGFWRAARRSAAREQGAPSQLASPRATPSHELRAREDATAFQAAFELLSREQRDVVTWSRIERADHAEIARRLGKTEVAVRKILSRALTALAASMVRRGSGADRTGS